ncbi:MAG: hypothetical protein O2967_17930 [Proteobacteria bacterium]|nr:hypothetical protein [Pseudomonadota bacterium]
MKPAICLVVLTLLATGLTACDGSLFMRDNYMGQKWLEPELLPQQVPRDQDGNPQLQIQARELESFWQKFGTWSADPEPQVR